ncbi:hypothetical protein [Nocardioides sp. AE5]|uniref:hypothetical protein n=1 Tax=Nocardioides sp. AE5 TaxID=2962573 RepID=UPI0028814BE2|nr:hypothetical protein [Nocardioides sp. AE5]MDT0200991.1 hypothetical protein [Nocardioides sp. AE5]
MTTELQPASARTGASVLLLVSASTLAIGLVATLVGAFAAGSSAAWGALAGTLLVLVVLGGGTYVVSVVAQVMPSMSLLIAMLTYLLQVVLMGLVFLAMSRSGALDGPVDARWLAGVVIVGTLLWLGAQIVLTTRLRLPAYDLTDASAR